VPADLKGAPDNEPTEMATSGLKVRFPTNFIKDALDAGTATGTEALNSEEVQRGLKDTS
jgi:hypothetical protein